MGQGSSRNVRNGSRSFPQPLLQIAVQVACPSREPGAFHASANEGGTPLTFEHRQHGIHFPSHDQDAAVQAVLDVLDAGETMKQACVPHARTFTWERAINDLEGKYFKVLSRASKF